MLPFSFVNFISDNILITHVLKTVLTQLNPMPQICDHYFSACQSTRTSDQLVLQMSPYPCAVKCCSFTCAYICVHAMCAYNGLQLSKYSVK